MPIWFELLAMMLFAYVLGLTLGWAIWGPALAEESEGDTPL